MYVYIIKNAITYSHISKYKLSFQDGNDKPFHFHVTFQIPPLSD